MNHHHRRLMDELNEVARRYRHLFGWLACTIVWLGSAAAGAILTQAEWTFTVLPSSLVPILVTFVALASGIACWLATRSTWDRRWIARRIEAEHPDLETLLVTAVEQEPQMKEGRFGFLQDRLFRDALEHNREAVWQDDISDRRILVIQLTGLASLAMLSVVLVGLATQAAQARRMVHLTPGLQATPSITVYKVSVTPGEAEVERGTSLVITAEFSGKLPDDAAIVVRDASGETSRLPMSLSLSDPVFGARLQDIQADLSYRVEFAEQATEEYKVTVFEYPKLQRADTELEFPAYTSLPKKRVEDTRRITAVEGTEVTLFCNLNKPVERARLVDELGETLELESTADDPTVFAVSETLTESRRYELILTDSDGRTNREPPHVVFNVTPNQEPEVKITMPAKDMRVSPIEELQTKASLWDDFGLQAYGVNYTLPGQPPRELSLGKSTTKNERREVDHLIAFEDLEAKPDQLLAYYFWAEDIGPDGKPRRTMGDMYFAEVRHFEEIFRQGEQPPSGLSEEEQQQSGQNARQAEELAELQKQIINATWTVIRRETRAEPSDTFVTDVGEIKTGQADAISKLLDLVEELQDPQSQQHAEAVKGHMLDAMTNLMKATDTASPSILPQALSSEQAAYQALLKLRAREHEVTRGQQQQQQQSGSASGSQSRAQQQLEQLELDNEQNRYETERQASPQQDQQQRENLQVLNRLRELARRQNDLNKRLKELQSALEEAQTEEEKEDIRQQLKRLREQQQQMLRDMDELAERMERPENQERMSEQRDQVEQTRENIRRTTEALKDGQVSRAVASGTRAQRELEELEEEFRDAASNRFSEEVERLRDDVRRLDDREQELAEQLHDMKQAKRDTRSLREPTERVDLGDEFRQQRENLEQLLENIRETVEEAEEAEPLMAKQLYDSLREAQHQRVDDALDATRRLLDRDLTDEARRAEEQAAQGIENLREGVENAAESVLGNEDEALRRAHEALEDLAQELNEEIRRATGQPRDDRQDESQRRPGEQASQQHGQQDTEPPQPGEQQAGRPQEGEPRKGQPGQRQPRDGEQPPETQQAGQSQSGQQQEETTQQQQGQPGQRQGGNQPDPSQMAEGEELGQRNSAGQRQPGPGRLRDDARPSNQQDQRGRQVQTPSGIEQFRGPSGPITGEFLPWSDRLRDVEEMVDDPDLRSEAARVREAARDIRREMRRDFKGPNWDIVREFVAEPLNELRDRVAEELLRRDSDELTVPIDRDPVPAKYAEDVRRYYETLGTGK